MDVEPYTTPPFVTSVPLAIVAKKLGDVFIAIYEAIPVGGRECIQNETA